MTMPLPFIPTSVNRLACSLLPRLWFALLSASAPVFAFAADAPVVEQGYYVSIASDCVSCHAMPGAQAMTGGEPLKTPFGSIYPSNITPDVKTGIGSWSEADFARALRDGVRKGGAPLYPAMPYDHYTKISDPDVHALWEYFHSLPAVERKVPDNTLHFPFNVRSGVAVWKSAFFEPGRYVQDAQKDPVWNRGGYLVEALGHCGACHTPRNIAQASRQKQRFTGATIDGWYAPDISSDSLSSLRTKTVSDLEKLLKNGQNNAKNVKVFGPMQTVVHESLGRLTDDDIHAMAVYLKDQPADVKPQQPQTPVYLASRLAEGRAIYESNCASCHQIEGKGVAGTVPALAGNSAVTAREPFNVVMAMLDGFAPQGNWGAMASFADVLNDAQIADVANYVRSSWGNRAAHQSTAWGVGHLRASADTSIDHAAVVCPVIPADQLQPALMVGAEALEQAAADQGKLQQVVQRYVKARPQASAGQVTEALSTAYCRAVAKQTASKAYSGARMAAFSQDVASALVSVPRHSNGAKAHPTSHPAAP